MLDYEPFFIPVYRTVSGAKSLAIEAGIYPALRYRSIGQAVTLECVDEFNRGVTVNGLAATHNSKTWVYRDSGADNPPS